MREQQKPPECGTARGHTWHIYREEIPCTECKDAHNARRQALPSHQQKHTPRRKRPTGDSPKDAPTRLSAKQLQLLAPLDHLYDLLAEQPDGKQLADILGLPPRPEDIDVGATGFEPACRTF